MMHSQGILTNIVLLFLVTSTSLFASATIEVDNASPNIGAFVEGAKEYAEYTFTLKNTGDSTLIIKHVKPGCSCSKITYDSIIEPNKVGSIKVTIHLADAGEGDFKKVIKVISNSKTNSILNLQVSGTLLTHINASKKYIRFKPDQAKEYKDELILKSALASLQVTEVQFTDPKNTADKPIPFTATLTKSEAADEHGYYAYTLKITTQFKPVSKVSGKLTIKTNHPEKKVVSIESSIEP